MAHGAHGDRACDRWADRCPPRGAGAGVDEHAGRHDRGRDLLARARSLACWPGSRRCPSLDHVRLTASARSGSGHGEPRAASSKTTAEVKKKKRPPTVVTFTITARSASRERVMKARLAALPPRALVAIASRRRAPLRGRRLVSARRAQARRGGEPVRGRSRRRAPARRCRSSRLAARRMRPRGRGSPTCFGSRRRCRRVPTRPGSSSSSTDSRGSANATITSIAPGEESSPPAVRRRSPLSSTADGTYRQLTRFLQRTRALVSVRRGVVRTTGRLLTVQSVELTRVERQAGSRSSTRRSR